MIEKKKIEILILNAVGTASSVTNIDVGDNNDINNFSKCCVPNVYYCTYHSDNVRRSEYNDRRIIRGARRSAPVRAHFTFFSTLTPF